MIADPDLSARRLPSRLARFALLAPLALFAAFLLVVGFGPHRGPHAPADNPLIGHPAPAFDLPGYDTTHPGLAASDLARGAPVVINLFASWCAPCRAESPQLAALTAQGIVVNGIAVRDGPPGLAAFFNVYPNPYRRIGIDRTGQAFVAWGVAGIPETFVVDGRGIVRYHHTGDLRADDVATVAAEVRALAR